MTTPNRNILDLMTSHPDKFEIPDSPAPKKNLLTTAKDLASPAEKLSPPVRRKKYYWTLDLRNNIPVLDKKGNPVVKKFLDRFEMERYLRSHPEAIEVDQANAKIMGGLTNWRPKFICDFSTQVQLELKLAKEQLRELGLGHFSFCLKVQYGDASAIVKNSFERFPVNAILAKIAEVMNNATTQGSKEITLTLEILASQGVINHKGESRYGKFPVRKFSKEHTLSLDNFNVNHWYNQNRLTGEYKSRVLK
jgi:hypothetical protein